MDKQPDVSEKAILRRSLKEIARLDKLIPRKKSYRFDRGYDGLPPNHSTCIEKRDGSQHVVLLINTNHRGRTTVFVHADVSSHSYASELAIAIQNSYDELRERIVK
jgi:hypothetical protein